MGIKLTSIDDLTSEQVESKREELIAFVQEKYPEIDISHGVFSTLVLELSAIFGAKFEEEMNRLKSARSMKAIEDDPTLADDDAVEHILSNYNVSRKSGAFASGSITLLFAKNISYIIPAGYSFICNGISFATQQSYTIYSTNSSVISSDSLILTPRKEGGYICNIDVMAEEAGSAGCIRKNSEFEIVTPMASLIKAYATDDFTGGADVETNSIMLNRFKAGLATPCWGNRYNVEALIRAETSHIVDISVVGCGDIEMTRDQNTVFPVSLGGKTDIYIKTAPYSATKTLIRKAYLQNTDGNECVWSLNIPYDGFPGFWTVTSIYNNEKEIQGEIISENNFSWLLGLESKDCFFTKYQARDIEFTTPKALDLTVGTVLEFEVSLSGCPYIDEIQNIVSKTALKPISSDVLVHAPIPCTVYTTVHLNYNSNAELSEDQQLEIQKTVAAFINNTGFNQTLLVSDLIPLIQNHLVSQQKIASIQLDGIILSPQLKYKRVSSNQYLQIPEIPSEGITPRVTAYYTQPEFVSFDFNTEI